MSTENSRSNRFKRRQIYIDKDFQTRFIVKFVLILVLGGAISVALTFFNTQGTLTSSFVNSKLTIQNTSWAIMPSVIYTTLITTLVIGLVAVFVTLVVSHKIAGPMYRFDADIKKISQGDLKSRIRIRQGDQFQELADSLNTMIDSLEHNVGCIKKNVESLCEQENLSEECRDKLFRLNREIEARFKL